jgi:hypothetical protein
MRISACVVTAALAFPATSQAQDSFADAFWQFRANAGFDFSSGYYGAAKATEILYLPVTFQAAKGPWTLKATVPWLRVSGPALLIDGTGESMAGVRTSGAASGLGDINLSATYALEKLYNYGLFIDLTARVKAPTASFTKGLGTGEWDGAAQVDIAKSIGGTGPGTFMPFATLGYRITGDPNGFFLRNVFYGSVGVQYTWSDVFTSGVSYDARQAAIRAAADPEEMTAYTNIRLGQDWSANVYGVAGLSRNSPTAGGGVVLSYRWR